MKLRFKVVDYIRNNSSILKSATDFDFYLKADTWNDYGYRTVYHLHSAGPFTDGVVRPIGWLQIMKVGQTVNDSNILYSEFGYSVFTKLPDNFVSISFSLELYQKLSVLFNTSTLRKQFVDAFHLIFSKQDKAYLRVKDTDCFRKSFMRNSTMDSFVLKEGRRLLLGEETYYDITKQKVSFDFDDCDTTLNIAFDPVDQVSDTLAHTRDKIAANRIVAFIGNNGCGKSTILYRVARVLYANPKERNLYEKIKSITPNDIGFSRLIIISYSSFDSFQLPGKSVEDYRLLLDGLKTIGTGRFYYCGIRDVEREYEILIEQDSKFNSEKSVGDQVSSFTKKNKFTEERVNPVLKNPKQLGAEFFNNLILLSEDRVRWGLWRDFIERVREIYEIPNFAENPMDFGYMDEFFANLFNQCSTGWKFILHSMLHVIFRIENHSMLLFDEPENHIHPPLLSFYLKEINRLLDLYDSVMLIGTHSPVVVQELFSRNVFRINRVGGIMQISHPSIETFGASFGSIQSDVFFLNSDTSSYYEVIDSILNRNQGVTDPLARINLIEKELGISLNPKMRAYIAMRQ